MKNRTIMIVAIVLLVVASISLGAAMIISNAEDLLTQSLETLETVTDGHVVVEITMDLPDELADQLPMGAPAGLSLESISGTFEAWGKLDVGPNGEPAMRIEVLEASKSELVGLTIVSDGTQFWMYDPSRQSVIVGQAEEMRPLLEERFAEYEGESMHEGDFDPDTSDMPDTPAEFVEKVLEYFTAERLGSDQIAGTDAYKIRLLPNPEKMPDEVRLAGGYINIWLRATDQLPLAVEYAESAMAYGKAEATLVEINTDLDESVFSFDIPDGVEVIEATEFMAMMDEQKALSETIDFETMVATDLPEGSVEAEAQSIGGAVIQRYNLSDGLSFFVAQGASIPIEAPADSTSAEIVTIRGVDGTLVTNEEATRTMITWSDGELTFVIGGDLTPDQALAIAESLQ